MALSAVPALASGTQAEDVFKQFRTCQSVSLVYGTAACVKTNGTDADVTDPDNANAGPIVGLVLTQGAVTAGVFGAPALNDPLTIQRFGKGVGLLATSQTITRGDRLGTIAGTGGKIGAYAPGTGQKYVGIAAQSVTTSGTSKTIEVDINANPGANAGGPRQVTVSQPLKTTVLGAATVYGATTGVAFGSAAIQLYVCRTTGETARNLRASLGIAPGGSDTVIWTLMKSSDNGNTWANTALTCTITGAAFANSDATNSVALTAGDILALKAVSSAGTAAGAAATFDITQ